MSAAPRRAAVEMHTDIDDDVFLDGVSPDGVRPGERIGRSGFVRHRRGLRWAVVLTIAGIGGGAWLLLGETAAMQSWQVASEWAAGLAKPLAGGPREVPPPPVPQVASHAPPLASADVPTVEPDGRAPGSRQASLETAALTPAGAGALSPAAPGSQPDARGAGPAETKTVREAPLPPSPAEAPADPLEQRAAAAGLHPGLSRVLLRRLSPADYQNAEIAISKALAETPDTGELAWPRQRSPGLALFQVRFVEGAAPGCRRYVVMITKDGWDTTALPMERCGVRRGRADARK